MTRIGRNPGLRRLPLAIVVSAGGAVAIGLQMPRIFDAPSAVPIGIAVSFVFLLVLIFCAAVLPYGLLSWDERAGTATFGRRTVPLATITRVVRSVSAAGGVVSIVYRFFSTDGPSVRVLVAGRPMKGIDQEALTELRRFIRALPIVEPPRTDGLTDEQSAVVDAMSDVGGRSSVGKRLLLEELEAILGPEHPSDLMNTPQMPTPGGTLTPAAHADAGKAGPVLSAQEATALAEQWERDDRDAAAYLADKRIAAAIVRRVFFWVTVLAVVVAAGAIVAGVVIETTHGWVDSDTNDLLGIALVGCGVVGGLSYFGWCAAADAHVRRLQALGRAWLDSRDLEQRTRGLAPELLAAWTQPAPGTRLIRAVCYVTASLSGLALIAVPVIITTEEDILTPAALLWTTIIAIVVLGLSIVGFVVTARARREARQQFVLLAGWRLMPPKVEPAAEVEGAG
ncbi:hypothetical protein [Microbacterium sp. NPDC087665]|uniref:hypothetical protein n=1 Tax=Microbacterium sp. NPDC087665 TaxID=3364194 RepID=UPI0037F24572